MRTSEGLGEDMCKLITRLHKFYNNISRGYLSSNKVSVNLNVLGSLMKYRIRCDMKGHLVITHVPFDQFSKFWFSQQLFKIHTSLQVATIITRYSDSALDWATTLFLLTPNYLLLKHNIQMSNVCQRVILPNQRMYIQWYSYGLDLEE